MKFKALLIIIVLIGIITSKTIGQSIPLRLKDCLKLAVDNNAKVKTSVLDYNNTFYQIEEIRSSGLPQINASGSIEDYIKIPTQLIPGEIFGQPGTMIPVQFGTKYNVSANLEASQLIYSQSFINALKLSKKSIDLRSLNIQKSKEEVIYETAQIYYGILISRKQLQNLNDNIEKINKLYPVVENQYKAGLIKHVDLDRITVTKNNLQSEIDNLNLIVEQQINLLKFNMGVKQSENIQLPDSITIDEKINIPSDNYEQVHIDLQIIQKQKELAILNKKINESAYFPTVSAFGRYSYQNMDDKFNFYEKTAKWYKIAVIGVSLNIPIFDGLQKEAKIKQSKIQLRQLEIAEQNTKEYMSIEQKNAIGKYKNSSLAFHRQLENVKLAEKVYSITQDQYKQGVASLTDLLNAESSKKESQTIQNQALIQLKMAELELAKSNGTLLEMLK